MMKIDGADLNFWPRAQRDRRAAGGAEEGASWLEATRASTGSAFPGLASPSSTGLALTLSDMRTIDAETRQTKAKASGQAAVEVFSKWVKMSIAEKIRAQILEQHGMTEETLRDLPTEKRKMIEDEIKAEIKRQLGADRDKRGGSAHAA